MVGYFILYRAFQWLLCRKLVACAVESLWQAYIQLVYNYTMNSDVIIIVLVAAERHFAVVVHHPFIQRVAEFIIIISCITRRLVSE